ncbi:hypothetical protein LAZ67_4002477 [Cordylochernes scorpioides]|uniref:DUF5641 domain-containing protein n=1 Tax=Cordylochernes scorpioides TaxID=51811 RepID=A0ABY6KHJ1_9ARAC|nr:hypothetical protein LAZ67_4002477 [Cordylochernes scorpioides]
MSILVRFNMMECRGVSTPLDNSIPIRKKDCLTTDKEKDDMKHVPYRELIGSLLYFANSSRPDTTFAVTKLAQFCSNPGERHWQAAKHILRYLQANKNVSLIYKRGSDDILEFSDSDGANDIDVRRSTSGSAVTINGCLVSWRSEKQNCVSLSTMESEYIAFAQTTKEILWIAQILENFKCLTDASRPITIFCDNRATIEFSKNNIENNMSNYIDILYHYIREKVNSGDIHVNYISTNDNLADIFTKGLKKTAHQNACAAMNCLDTGILPGISKPQLIAQQNKLKRIIGWIFRLFYNCRKPLQKEKSGALSLEEIETSFNRIIRCAQQEDYYIDFRQIEALQPLSGKSPSKNLNPSLDKGGLLRAVQQLMGNLPASRINWTRPFTKKGIDFAEPKRLIVGKYKLTFEEITTVLTQIEACLNSRSLCPLTDDPEDLTALTAGHFLIGMTLTAVPSLVRESSSSLKGRWQLVEQIKTDFWKRWSCECFSRLQNRPKWLEPVENIKIGT